MKATALITHEDPSFTLETVELPELEPDQVLVRTCFSGVSIGTEFALIRNKLNWGPYPLCTGYQATGIVEAVGAAVDGFAVGDKVYCRGGDGLTLADGRSVSMVSGAHASHLVRRCNTSHGVDHIVRDADLATAAMFVMPAVGLFGVDMAGPRLGDTVVIHGCGLIGLGALAACVHRGCRVIAVDINARQLELAGEFGADHCLNGAEQDVGAAVQQLTDGGADVVFECTGIPACIDQAIPLCRAGGKFVWQGNYGAAPVSLHFLPAHGRKLQMFFPCDDGLQPCRRAVIRNMAMGALKWEKAITHRIPCTEAPAMYDRINRGDRDVVGVVIDWREV